MTACPIEMPDRRRAGRLRPGDNPPSVKWFAFLNGTYITARVTECTSSRLAFPGPVPTASSLRRRLNCTIERCVAMERITRSNAADEQTPWISWSTAFLTDIRDYLFKSLAIVR